MPATLASQRRKPAWTYANWEGQTWGRGDGTADGNGNLTTNRFFNDPNPLYSGQLHDVVNVSPKLQSWRDWVANVGSGPPPAATVTQFPVQQFPAQQFPAQQFGGALVATVTGMAAITPGAIGVAATGTGTGTVEGTAAITLRAVAASGAGTTGATQILYCDPRQCVLAGTDTDDYSIDPRQAVLVH